MPKSVLALDIATTTGWAFGRIGEKPICGAQRFGDKNAIDDDVWREALVFAKDQIQLHRPDVVALEAPIMSSSPAGGSNPHTQMRLIGLQAVMRTVVRTLRPNPAKLVNVQSARKFFIGRGNLPGAEAKSLVKRRCIQLSWIAPEDATYDKCDALCVWAKAAADVDRSFAANFTELGTANVVRLVPQSEEMF